MKTERTHTLAFLFTTFPPEVSGSAHYNWERVVWLARQGDYRVVVLAPDCQEPENFPKVPTDLEGRLYLEALPSKPWLLYNLDYNPTTAAMNQIERRLEAYRPDLITVVDVERFFLFSTWRLPGLQYARKHRIPYLTEFITDYYNFSATYLGGKLVRDFTFRPMQRYLYGKFDTALVPSRFAGSVLAHLGVTNTRYVPFFGVDLFGYTSANRDRTAMTEWLPPAEGDHKVILYLGRLSFEKRVNLLIEAFARLKGRRPNCSLLIAGGGPDDAMRQLKRLAARVPSVHFTGFVQGRKKAMLYASCDAFCHTGPYETFGRTIVEAMASGVPVVTVNSGAVAENIEEGRTGFLVPPDDPESLALALEKAVYADQTDLIENALQAAQGFTVEQGCRNLHAYYLDLLRAPATQCQQPGLLT